MRAWPMQDMLIAFRTCSLIGRIAANVSDSSSAVLITAWDQRGSSRSVHTLRWRDLCMLSLIVLSMIVALAVPSLVWAQKLPVLPSEKEQTSAQGTIAQASLPATDEEIDKAVDRIEFRLVALRKESAAAAEATDTEKTKLLTAPPDELRKRQRLLGELVNTLDRYAQGLRELKDIRRASSERSAEMRVWQGYTEKPPFPISLLDGLRDSILAQRLDLETLELRLTVARGNLRKFTKDLSVSQKELRFASERLEKSVGTTAEGRQRWLLDLMRLQNDLNEAAIANAETQRLMLEKATSDKKEYIRFLEQKLAVAEKVSPLSKTDLEQKLQELDNQRRMLELDLGRTVKEEDELKAALKRSRDALARALTGIKPGMKPTPRQLAEVARLQSSVEKEQALVEAAAGQADVMRGLLQLVDVSQTMWEDRYWLTQNQDISQIREKIDQTQLVMASIQIWRKFVETRITKWATLIQSQRDKIEKAHRTWAERETDRVIMKAYEDRQTLLLRAAEALGRVERLANRMTDELKERQEHAPFVSRVNKIFADIISFFKRMWNIELYVAEETVIAEGTKIVKPVGVTLGKVLQAIVILVAGWWLARHLIRPIRWLVTTRFHKDESFADQVSKIFLLIVFVGVLVLSLVSVNIPLAVFAFLGGALVIGVGFGAQNLINNFISGMILLFDRSISVGDIVEVEGQGGTVTAIGMRSSHIKRFDGVELLVPNSQFLQQKVTNWTLSDNRMRYSVAVGVAYGSPTRQVSQILLETVEGHELVLKDPPAAVLFENFADSALTFTVYFWLELISARDNRAVASEIRHRISEALAGAGVVIAFPQRDVHIDAQGPIAVKIVPPGQ
jgi:potassium-dependent mechanosensitive channel